MTEMKSRPLAGAATVNRDGDNNSLGAGYDKAANLVAAGSMSFQSGQTVTERAPAACTLAAALEYADVGVAVFPVGPEQ